MPSTTGSPQTRIAHQPSVSEFGPNTNRREAKIGKVGVIGVGLELQNARLVVDEAAAHPAGLVGRRIVMVVPRPATLSALTLPPCASPRPRTMARPSPRPSPPLASRRRDFSAR